MITKLWGIPGTSHVPSPEKELKKLIDKAKREAQQEINKIANKVKNDTERALKKASSGDTDRYCNFIQQSRGRHRGCRAGGR